MKLKDFFNKYINNIIYYNVFINNNIKYIISFFYKFIHYHENNIIFIRFKKFNYEIY